MSDEKRHPVTILCIYIVICLCFFTSVSAITGCATAHGTGDASWEWPHES
jgi:hypothetical protein